jgi:hypothetical protein
VPLDDRTAFGSPKQKKQFGEPHVNQHYLRQAEIFSGYTSDPHTIDPKRLPSTLIRLDALPKNGIQSVPLHTPPAMRTPPSELVVPHPIVIGPQMAYNKY